MRQARAPEPVLAPDRAIEPAAGLADGVVDYVVFDELLSDLCDRFRRTGQGIGFEAALLKRAEQKIFVAGFEIGGPVLDIVGPLQRGGERVEGGLDFVDGAGGFSPCERERRERTVRGAARGDFPSEAVGQGVTPVLVEGAASLAFDVGAGDALDGSVEIRAGIRELPEDCEPFEKHGFGEKKFVGRWSELTVEMAVVNERMDHQAEVAERGATRALRVDRFESFRLEKRIEHREWRELPGPARVAARPDFQAPREFGRHFTCAGADRSQDAIEFAFESLGFAFDIHTAAVGRDRVAPD